MKNILLDTSAYSNLIRGDREVQELLEKADRVWMSSIVMGELLAGFSFGRKNKENRDILERFLEKRSVRTADVNQETAEFFAIIATQLRKSGTPIPTNDIWIAAQALEMGAVVVTFDGHFEKVFGLRSLVFG